MAQCETMKVKLKNGGREVLINVSDFDAERHEEITEKKAAPKKAATKKATAKTASE